jgi:hypothetical protein
MYSLIPLWIIGGPFVGLLILSFSFKNGRAMTESMSLPQDRDRPADPSAPLLQPMHPNAPRRFV